ncbi:hypothetical protein K4K56_007108 [Colletotrichum sp. SAR 10_98]|nr:hypothetical protein K4K56_007108 [Colletotrichum sp. SAR 10_98]
MMASNPPRITPIPIPVPGHAPSPQSAPATSATKVLNSTAANRNASPSSVSSAGEDPARKMKRTSAKVNVKPGAFLQAPPWAASLLSSKPSTSTSTGSVGANSVSGAGVPNLAPPTQDHSMVLDSPEPIRIESDILPPNPEGPVKSEFSPEDTPLEDVTPAKPSLSMSSQIQALQQSWQAKSTPADSQGSEEIIRRVSSGVQLDSGNADPPPRPFKMLPTLYGRPENELITTNDGDRLYCQWKGENTPLEASCGAVLPTGYTLHSDPEYPFICPDRVCRSIFRSIQGLGKHFGTASDSAPASTSSTKAAPAVIVPPNADQTMPAELLDMEEWEIAPGRVRDDQSQEPTNVAFSNAYLTSNQAVSVSEDIAFNVIVIKPGGSHRWTDEEDKVRICSVAVGKVKVKLDMTDPFQIGPNGMFRLKPGTSCSIENRTYIDAIIHVTSVTLY